MLVELVYPKYVVLREKISRIMLRELLLLLYGESQGVSRVHPLEYRLSVIDVVAALPDVEVDDADGVHLSHLGILVALVDVLSDGLGRPA